MGEENLIAALKECRERPSSEIMDHQIAAAGKFAHGAPQHDDMTIVVLKVLSC